MGDLKRQLASQLMYSMRQLRAILVHNFHDVGIDSPLPA